MAVVLRLIKHRIKGIDEDSIEVEGDSRSMQPIQTIFLPDKGSIGLKLGEDVEVLYWGFQEKIEKGKGQDCRVLLVATENGKVLINNVPAVGSHF